MYSFRICEDRYLFSDLVIRDSTLYCVSTYYNDYKVNFAKVDMKVNGKKLTSFKESGYDEPEPCRIIMYTVEPATSYDIEVSFLHRNMKYTILPEKSKSWTFIACTLFKYDYYNIEGYYHYYKKQGVEKFFLYYNGLLSEMKGKLFTAPEIEYYEWPFCYFDTQPSKDIRYHGNGYYKMMNVKPNHGHHAQLMFLNTVRIKYFPYTEYLLLNDLDEYIYNPDRTILEQVKMISKPCVAFANKWSAIKEETKDAYVLNVSTVMHDMYCRSKEHSTKNCEKKCDGYDRAKCVYHKSYTGFFGVHHPKYNTFYEDDSTGMYHIIDKGHPERTDVIIKSYEFVVKK